MTLQLNACTYRTTMGTRWYILHRRVCVLVCGRGWGDPSLENVQLGAELMVCHSSRSWGTVVSCSEGVTHRDTLFHRDDSLAVTLCSPINCTRLGRHPRLKPAFFIRLSMELFCMFVYDFFVCLCLSIDLAAPLLTTKAFYGEWRIWFSLSGEL